MARRAFWILCSLCCLWAGRDAAEAQTAAAPRFGLLISTSGADRRFDLQPVEVALARAGFATTSVSEPNRVRMKAALRDFIAKLPRGGAALVFFHGPMARIGQSNVILPADADLARGDAMREAGIDLNAVESDLTARGVGVKILIVDGTAVDSGGGRGGSPAALELHDGTLAMLNAAQDRRLDGGEDASVFLAEFLKQFDMRGATAEQVFAQTRMNVAKATGGRQVPSVVSSLLDDFFFLPAKADAALAVAVADASSRSPSLGSPEPAAAAQTASATPQPGETFRDCESCPELVVVPEGEFVMGSTESDYEKPPHRVVIAKPFAIGRHEVTFAQWDACAAAGACKADIDDHGFGRGDRPVIDVSWDEVQAYLKWLSARTRQSYRLPSEAEWEYAARAGSKTPFSWGPAVSTGKANCDDCSATPARATLPVGSFRPNAFGLYDTAGNAAEWVDDCWNAGYRGAPADGSARRGGQCELRVLRGGSFGTKAHAARSSARFRYDHDVRYYANGFRLARDLGAR